MKRGYLFLLLGIAAGYFLGQYVTAAACVDLYTYTAAGSGQVPSSTTSLPEDIPRVPR